MTSSAIRNDYDNGCGKRILPIECLSTQSTLLLNPEAAELPSYVSPAPNSSTPLASSPAILNGTESSETNHPCAK